MGRHVVQMHDDLKGTVFQDCKGILKSSGGPKKPVFLSPEEYSKLPPKYVYMYRISVRYSFSKMISNTKKNYGRYLTKICISVLRRTSKDKATCNFFDTT